jgi:GTP-binding protein
MIKNFKYDIVFPHVPWQARIGALNFTVMDTGGLEGRLGGDSMEDKMLEHTKRAVQHADVVLFMIDARVGVTVEDQQYAR